MLLAAVLALAVLSASSQHAAAVTTLPTVQTDQLMGIRTYSFLIAAPAEGLNSSSSSTAYELRVHLRAACDSSGAKVLLRGFAGAFPIEGSAPTGLSLFAPHFQPPSLQQHRLQVVSSPATNTTPTTLKWLGPSNQGLWRFEGRVRKPSGRELLTLQGSSRTHQLPLSCDKEPRGLAGALALGRPQPTPLPPEGLWNVITTTSANGLTPETLSYLLVLHMQYHERLGFNGTILRWGGLAGWVGGWVGMTWEAATGTEGGGGLGLSGIVFRFTGGQMGGWVRMMWQATAARCATAICAADTA